MNKKISGSQIKQVQVRTKSPVDLYSAQFNVPASLIYAVIVHESGGKSDSVGTHGEIGLMQIMQGALTDFNNMSGVNTFVLHDLYTPEVNILVGTWYLHHLHDSYGFTWYDTLRAYNAGASRVKKSTTISKTYAESVINIQKLFEV